MIKIRIMRDFPGGPVVKNPPYNAGNSGSIPGRGTKIPHATGQLSLHTTTTELVRLNQKARVLQNYRAHALWNLCATTIEPMHPVAYTPQLEKRKPAHHKQREVCAPQRRVCVLQGKIPGASSKIPCAATKTRRSQN